VITSAVEHHAVLHPVETLKETGLFHNDTPVDSEGMVDPDDVRRAITPETFPD